LPKNNTNQLNPLNPVVKKNMYNEHKPKYAFVTADSNKFGKNWPKGLKPKPKRVRPDARGRKIIWKEK